jgi:hypothetical protein
MNSPGDLDFELLLEARLSDLNRAVLIYKLGNVNVAIKFDQKPS